jgi:hypothetical protein
VSEPYRYERDVEEFLRWSPSVQEGAGKRLSGREIAELERLLQAYAGSGAAQRAQAPEQAPPEPEPEPVAREPEPEPVPPPPAPEPQPEPVAPVEHYDDLASEEIIALLGSLEDEDLAALGEYERTARARRTVLDAIEGLLARRAAAARS